MAAQGKETAAIIKRKKVIAPHMHYGGAWKVAYADFVTAMMAFFLLMWLLNATTERQRKGLADYFNPTVPINRISGGGDGVLGGESVFSDEARVRNATGGDADGPAAAMPDPAELQAVHETVEEALFDRGGESRSMEQLLRHVVTRVTDEGLVIEIFDLPDAPLFQGDTARPGEATVALAGVLAEVLNLTRNRIGFAGHLRRSANPDSMLWNLSSQRAQTIRLLLQDSGVDPQRVQRVTGHADRVPVVADETALRNNRVEIILIRRDR